MSVATTGFAISIASMMVRDHTGVNEKAVALAKKLGVTPKDNAVSQSLEAGAKDAKEVTAYNVRAILAIERAQKQGFMATPKDRFNLIGIHFNIQQYYIEQFLVEALRIEPGWRFARWRDQHDDFALHIAVGIGGRQVCQSAARHFLESLRQFAAYCSLAHFTQTLRQVFQQLVNALGRFIKDQRRLRLLQFLKKPLSGAALGRGRP